MATKGCCGAFAAYTATGIAVGVIMSILVIPIMKKGSNLDHLLLLDIGFHGNRELPKKVAALGDECTHMRNIAEEAGLSWKDEYLNLLETEELFGKSAEKIAECIIASCSTEKP